MTAPSPSPFPPSRNLPVHVAPAAQRPPTTGLDLFLLLPQCLLSHLLSSSSLHPNTLTSLLQAAAPYPALHNHVSVTIQKAARLQLGSTPRGSLILDTKRPHESYLSLLQFSSLLDSAAVHPRGRTSIWSCGRNDLGQGARETMEDVNAVCRTTRVASRGGEYEGPPAEVLFVGAGMNHSACVTACGGLQVVGANRRGQLGLGDFEGRRAWTVVAGMGNTRVSQVACGGMHTVVLTGNGGVMVSGANDYGQLGMGVSVGCVEFRQVEGFGEGFVQVAAGMRHSVMLREDGRVFGAGDNGSGQLGGRRGGGRGTFEEVVCFGRRVVRVACGSETTMMLTVDNMVLVTGKRQCGLSVIGGLGGGMVTHLSVGEGFAIARTGRCEVGVSVHRKRFFVTEELEGVQARCVSAGIAHYAVVTEGGGVLAAGGNAFGQVAAGEMGLTIEGGHDARVIRPHRVALSRVEIPRGYRTVQVAAGAFHTLFLLEETEDG